MPGIIKRLIKSYLYCQDNREPGENPGRSGHCNQSSHLQIPLYEKASCLTYEKVQNMGIWRISSCICGILRNPDCKSGNLLRNVKVLPKKANITDTRTLSFLYGKEDHHPLRKKRVFLFKKGAGK